MAAERNAMNEQRRRRRNNNIGGKERNQAQVGMAVIFILLKICF
jgi:hypothetical protein